MTTNDTEEGDTETVYPLVLVVQTGVKLKVPAVVGALSVNVPELVTVEADVTVKPLVGVRVQVTVAAGVLFVTLTTGAAGVGVAPSV